MINPPTPETISIIVTASGSTSSDRPTSKPPAASQVQAVVTSSRSSWPRPSRPTKAAIAPPKAVKTESVESHAAVRREIDSPRRVIRSAPASGASRQSHAPPIIWTTQSSAQHPQPVDVEVEPLARDRDDQAEADDDLGGGDGHHGE